MWSARRTGSVLAAMAGVLALGACQVHPLYGSGGGGTHSSPVPELASISIDEPVNREEQVFRNALTFGLRGGAGAEAARYRLNYRMIVSEQELGVERFTGTPRAYQMTGRVSFVLEDVATGRPVMSDQATAGASFDRSSQNFANVRARRDAVNRLARTLASQVEIRLATYFATI